MASLNDFINPDLKTSDITHSSGYVSNSGAGLGAGGLSLVQRGQLANKPRIVGSYAMSHLGRRYGAAKARTVDDKSGGRAYDANADTFQDQATYGSNRQSGKIADKAQIDKSVERAQHFVEPPSRNYNPYG